MKTSEVTALNGIALNLPLLIFKLTSSKSNVNVRVGTKRAKAARWEHQSNAHHLKYVSFQAVHAKISMVFKCCQCKTQLHGSPVAWSQTLKFHWDCNNEFAYFLTILMPCLHNANFELNQRFSAVVWLFMSHTNSAGFLWNWRFLSPGLRVECLERCEIAVHSPRSCSQCYFSALVQAEQQQTTADTKVLFVLLTFFSV